VCALVTGAVKKVPEKKKDASKQKDLEAFSFFGTIFVS
jgi:hypothetical protein